jgi:small-conductance mechanosensitive channel
MNALHGPMNFDELEALLGRVFSPAAVGEWALLLTCLGLAALVAWWAGRRGTRGTVLIGEGALDGALFPLLALALVFGARLLLPHFGLAPALFRLAMPVLVSLALIRLVVRVLAAAWPDSGAIKLAERLGSWIAWGATVLWITGLLPVLLDELDDVGWKFGSVRLTLRNFVEGGFSAVLVMLVALWISAGIEARLMRQTTLDLSMRKMAANVVRALLLFIGLILALSAVGIDLTALGVLGGALGVGLGFGLQKLAANYVSGFVILAERSLRIGDMVKVDGFEGKVTDIKTRYTVIRSLTGREAIVPNELLITQRVENSSLADPRVQVTSLVQVAYGCDVAAVMQALANAVSEVPRVLEQPRPVVHLNQFAADGLELLVVFWIADPENGAGGVKSEVNLAILRTLDGLGVAIPFPQREVRLTAGSPAPAPATPGPGSSPA